MVLRVLCVVLTLWLNEVAFALELQKTTIEILPHYEPIKKTGSINTFRLKNTKKNSKLSAVKLIVELALSFDEQEQGLMYRKSLAPGYGMLFIFPNEQPRQFWMKNTLIPLSIAFIDEKKTIFQISDMNPVKTLIQKKYDRAASIKPAKYVLEVPQGWFLVHKIGVGSKIIGLNEEKFLKVKTK